MITYSNINQPNIQPPQLLLKYHILELFFIHLWFWSFWHICNWHGVTVLAYVLTWGVFHSWKFVARHYFIYFFHLRAWLFHCVHNLFDFHLIWDRFLNRVIWFFYFWNWFLWLWAYFFLELNFRTRDLTDGFRFFTTNALDIWEWMVGWGPCMCKTTELISLSLLWRLKLIILPQIWTMLNIIWNLWQIHTTICMPYITWVSRALFLANWNVERNVRHCLF